jgi:hypothetical protein
MLNKLLDNKGKKTILIALIVAVLGWAGLNISESDVSKYVNMAMPDAAVSEVVEPQQSPPSPSEEKAITPDFNKASHISPQRRTHILYGDATGGGHLHGTGKPCKSEFPKHWTEQTVIKEVELIAANDNLNWEQQRNGYYVTTQQVGTVRIKVVKGRDGQSVITAYPTNVPRNACPANDR